MNLPCTSLSEYEGTLFVVPENWELEFISDSNFWEKKNEVKPNKIKSELTQHDADFLVLLLEK